jgi:hypothetical protein
MEKFTKLEEDVVKIVESIGDIVSIDSTEDEVETQPETLNEVTESNPVKFFSKLFEGKEMAHMFHLRAQGDGSHASHVALESYYEDVIEDIDDLIEVYQGQYDLVEGYDIIDKESNSSNEPVQYFIELAEFIKRTRYSAILEEDAHLQSIIDEVLVKSYKLIYKLRFLN